MEDRGNGQSFALVGKIEEGQARAELPLPTDFFSFSLSVDGVMGKEDQVILAILIQLMAAKMEEPILNVKGWVNSRIAIAIARSYSLVLYGAWFPSTLHTRETYWELGLGLGLAQ